MSKKVLPKGKVIVYAYVKPENKAWFVAQASKVGGNSKAMDILLDDLRVRKKVLKPRFSREI